MCPCCNDCDETNKHLMYECQNVKEILNISNKILSLMFYGNMLLNKNYPCRVICCRLLRIHILSPATVYAGTRDTYFRPKDIL